MFNSNQAFLIGAKVEIIPKGFTLRVKVAIEEEKINLPQVTNKC
jgi:hypothetical protein